MEIRYKKLDERAVKPFKKHDVDAGFDLTAIWREEGEKYIEYGTGIAFEIPTGYVGLMFPRSSVRDQDLILKNCVGVVDASYRGEIKFSFWGTKVKKYTMGKESHFSYDGDVYNVGERCGQIVFMEIPFVRLIESEELSETERGTAGYGSSGK